MQNLAPSVLDDEEAIQHAKREGRDGEEIEGGDDFAVVVEEREPTLCFTVVTMALKLLEVA